VTTTDHPDSVRSAPTLITDTEALVALARRCLDCDRIAVDCEGNGLHAYRSALCCMQLAWSADGRIEVAIVDTLDLDLEPLHELLGPRGPIKVLHDLTFDARMLVERGCTIDNLRDTSVAARFLGERATGLATLVETRLGVTLSKGLQSHDWAERPFTSKQLAYLAGDVEHLLQLDARLAQEVADAGVAEEVALECGYKLWTALGPPKDTRHPHERIKGYGKLSPLEQAVLQHLCQAREQIAEEANRPPFKVVSNAALLEMAKRKPNSSDALRQCSQRGLTRHARHWLAAVERGIAEGVPTLVTVVPEPPRTTRAQIALRKRLDSALSQWRQKEAGARGVDLQVVLPGHCTSGVVAALAEHVDAGSTMETLPERLAEVRGLGKTRIERYLPAWGELATRRPEEAAPPEASSPPPQ
jgi:ribonuclease D